MLSGALLFLSVAIVEYCHSMEPYIVGGKPASIEQYSYCAFMQVGIGEIHFICGASILNQHIVLTAAHCFASRSRKVKVALRAGSTDKRNGTLRHSTTVAIHLGFSSQHLENDIALVYLKKPLVLRGNIKRVIIMKGLELSRVGYVVGWGMIDEDNKIKTDLLHIAEQQLWTRKECRRMVDRLPLGVVCGAVRGKYASIGDSGSALIIDGNLQVGLVSFTNLRSKRAIVMYTDLRYFYNWIVRTATNLHCSSN